MLFCNFFLLFHPPCYCHSQSFWPFFYLVLFLLEQLLLINFVAWLVVVAATVPSRKLLGFLFPLKWKENIFLPNYVKMQKSLIFLTMASLTPHPSPQMGPQGPFSSSWTSTRPKKMDKSKILQHYHRNGIITHLLENPCLQKVWLLKHVRETCEFQW